MRDVMVDLETLGRSAGCSILSIGAVEFDPVAQALGKEFYIVVDRKSCRAAGLLEDEQTVNWWNQQSTEAQSVLRQADVVGYELAMALRIFASYLEECHSMADIRIWGNGSDFDNAIIQSCYAAIKKEVPWNFWNNRCYRTLKNLVPKYKLDRKGVHHNALDDAKSQAHHAIGLLRSIPTAVDIPHINY